MTTLRARLYLIAALLSLMAGCSPSRPPPNTYLNRTEAEVRSELGEPERDFPGHYGNPPMQFKDQFKGEVRTLVFKKPGGQYYVSFEKRSDGSICICSNWLPDGWAF